MTRFSVQAITLVFVLYVKLVVLSFYFDLQISDYLLQVQAAVEENPY